MSQYAVPYVALGCRVKSVRAELLAAVELVLDSGHYILGPNVGAFEAEFARYCDAAQAVGVASGTGALHLVLRALGCRDGDEVITAPNSFVASAAAIAAAGLRPVFADVGPDLNIDPCRIEEAVTPRTRVVMPVHLTGRPANMDAIGELARRRGLLVVEDAAQAVGARLHGRSVGTLGDAACFSLHPLKNLHVFGDGGVVTTRHPEIARSVKLARNHGLRDRDTCEEWGFNCRLDELQAAMARIMLSHLDEWTARRRQLAFRYNDLLRPYVTVPEERPGEHCVYQTYVVQADRRDELMAHLRASGVEALVHYPAPIHMQPSAASLCYGPSAFPVAEHTARRILSLPLYETMTEDQQDRVAASIAAFFGS